MVGLAPLGRGLAPLGPPYELGPPYKLTHGRRVHYFPAPDGISWWDSLHSAHPTNSALPTNASRLKAGLRTLGQARLTPASRHFRYNRKNLQVPQSLTRYRSPVGKACWKDYRKWRIMAKVFTRPLPVKHWAGRDCQHPRQHIDPERLITESRKPCRLPGRFSFLQGVHLQGGDIMAEAARNPSRRRRRKYCGDLESTKVASLIFANKSTLYAMVHHCGLLPRMAAAWRETGPAAVLMAPGGPQAAEPPIEPAATVKPERPSKEALALAVLAHHPDWTDSLIAKEADCNRTTLYTFKKYMAAREIPRQGKNDLPRGSKSPDEALEAWENDDG